MEDLEKFLVSLKELKDKLDSPIEVSDGDVIVNDVKYFPFDNTNETTTVVELPIDENKDKQIKKPKKKVSLM